MADAGADKVESQEVESQKVKSQKVDAEKPGKLPPGKPDIDFLNDWPKTFGIVFAAMRQHPIVTILVFFFSTFEGQFVAPLNSGILSNTILLVILRRVIILTYQDLGKSMAGVGETSPQKTSQRELLSSLTKLGLTSLLYYVGCALLGVLLVVPGLWSLGAFALAEAILVIEKTSIVQAFKRSRELTRNYVVKTFLYTGFGPTILALIVAVSMGFVDGALTLIAREKTIYLNYICSGLANAMIIVILLSTHVLVVRMYVRLRGPDPADG